MTTAMHDINVCKVVKVEKTDDMEDVPVDETPEEEIPPGESKEEVKEEEYADEAKILTCMCELEIQA